MNENTTSAGRSARLLSAVTVVLYLLLGVGLVANVVTVVAAEGAKSQIVDMPSDHGTPDWSDERMLGADEDEDLGFYIGPDEMRSPIEQAMPWLFEPTAVPLLLLGTWLCTVATGIVAWLLRPRRF